MVSFIWNLQGLSFWWELARAARPLYMGKVFIFPLGHGFSTNIRFNNIFWKCIHYKPLFLQITSLAWAETTFKTADAILKMTLSNLTGNDVMWLIMTSLPVWRITYDMFVYFKRETFCGSNESYLSRLEAISVKIYTFINPYVFLGHPVNPFITLLPVQQWHNMGTIFSI